MARLCRIVVPNLPVYFTFNWTPITELTGHFLGDLEKKIKEDRIVSETGITIVKALEEKRNV